MTVKDSTEFITQRFVDELVNLSGGGGGLFDPHPWPEYKCPFIIIGEKVASCQRIGGNICWFRDDC